MYKQDFPNSDLRKGTGSAIHQAFGAFCRLVSRPRRYEVLRDRVGRVGFVIGQIILVAKRSMNGDVVSVHKIIWDRCLKENKKILIYMADSGYFYRFDPKKIKDFAENERGGQKMINFSIREGKNLMKLRATAVKVDIVVEKNYDQYLKELHQQGVFG